MTEKMTYWELGVALEKAALAFKELPNSIALELSDIEQVQLAELISTATATLQNASALRAAIDAEAVGICDAANDHYRKVKAAREELAKRIVALPPLPEVAPPWGLEKLIDIAERFAHLSDDQWKRVAELASALGRKTED